jgi:hypothetical protein
MVRQVTFVPHVLELEDGARLELRRLVPAGAQWVLVDPDGEERAVDVLAAAAAAGDDLWRVLEATQLELEHWLEPGSKRVSVAERHPHPDPYVQALHAGWVEAWNRLTQAERPPNPILATALGLQLRIAGALGEHDVHFLVRGHRGDHEATILAVLDFVRGAGDDTIAILDAGCGYVQLMDRKALPALYAEADDPAVYGRTPLPEEVRAALAELGWGDPKSELMPYEEPVYGNEWPGANFAREWVRGTPLDEIAAVLRRTLVAYGLQSTDDLEVKVFPAVT